MEKNVTITISPITVKASGNTNQELLENAKKLVLESMQAQFPSIGYAFSDPNSLSLEDAHPGLIVSAVKGGELGIVTSIGKKNINVTLKGNRDVSGTPQAFFKSSATFEEARSKREESFKPSWMEGDSGYIKVGNEICAVVVGKKAGQKTKLYIVNEKRVVSATDGQIKQLLKDERSELE